MGKKFLKMIIFLLFLTLFFLLLHLKIGILSLSFSELFFLSKVSENQEIVELRWSRVLTSVLVGVALPSSGWLLQEFFKNPLASADVLGVSSVSGLMVAVSLLSVDFFSFLSSEILGYSFVSLMAILGGGVMMFFLIFLSSKNKDNTHIIIIGFLISALCGALISFLEFYAEDHRLKHYILWSVGGNFYLSFWQLLILFGMIGVGLFFVFKSVKPLLGSILGDDYARSFGVDLKKLKSYVILSTSFLSASVTAFVGPVVFVGIIVPYFCRIIGNPSKFWHQCLLNIVFGVLIMQFFSIISELTTLPINVLTSLFGIPVILLMLLKK